MNDRRTQMKWLLALTALSLVPVYGLIGWGTGGHGPDTVAPIVWLIEAGAWCLRALVEAWALVYLFSTNTTNQTYSRALAAIEIALIGLIAVTVTLLIISNGSNTPVSKLPTPLFWVWAASVAMFAPLMFGGIGIAYKANEPLEPDTNRLDTIANELDALRQLVATLSNGSSDSIVARRDRVLALLGEGLTQPAIAKQEGVSLGTIRNDVKALNGKVKH
jgi:DNA-binding CsgD family transcriptional regulator